MEQPAEKSADAPSAERKALVGGDLPVRTAAAAVMAGLALTAAWAGGLPFLVFWLVAAIAVQWEWQRLIGGERLALRVVVGAVALAAAAYVASPFVFRASIVGSTGLVVAGALAVAWIASSEARVWAGLGTLYAGALVVSVCLLRASPAHGFAVILWLFAVVWGADVLAYFGGRMIGGPKLWPRVSPGKTWSGALIGAAGGAVLGLLLSPWASGSASRFVDLLLIGLATAVVSELGDLFESALKRRYGVKDSSKLIPGHGGVMDRLDAFVFAAAFAAVVAAVRSSGDFIAGGLFQW
jgi:phosphatidate cytidylyltransferase